MYKYLFILICNKYSSLIPKLIKTVLDNYLNFLSFSNLNCKFSFLFILEITNIFFTKCIVKKMLFRGQIFDVEL